MEGDESEEGVDDDDDDGDEERVMTKVMMRITVMMVAVPCLPQFLRMLKWRGLEDGVICPTIAALSSCMHWETSSRMMVTIGAMKRVRVTVRVRAMVMVRAKPYDPREWL